MKRRNFLKLGSAAIASSGLMGMPQVSKASHAAGADYKALVCIFLDGGNDGFNMVVPRSNFEYDEYAAARQNMAIAKNDILAINPATAGGAQFGLHPEMAGVQNLFETGKLAVMGNVGNLTEPATKAELENRSKSRPRQLFSHNDQQDQWKYGDPLTSRTGWGGRLADYYVSQNTTNPALTSISVDGRTPWLVSDTNLDLSIGRNGFDRYDYVRPDSNSRADRRNAFRSLLQNDYNDPLINEFASLQNRTMTLVEDVGQIISNVADFQTTVPTERNSLAERLRMVARMIAARDELGMHRQVFYVRTGGFDTHDNQLNNQPRLLRQLSEALKYFYDVTTELGVASEVTSFTCSEFGRTLTSNGNGTDHAWGSHQLVMGDAVRGGDIYGAMPSLEIGGPDDYRSDGRIIPTTSVEQYSVGMLRWYGLSDSEIATVLPNLASFDANAVNFML